MARWKNREKYIKNHFQNRVRHSARSSVYNCVYNYTLLLALALQLTAPAFAAQERLPVEAFAQLPAISTMKLSPGGDYLAVVANVQGHSVLFTQELATGKKNMIARTDNEKYVFRWINWANEERVLASLWFPDRRYGVATGETRLVSVGRSDSKLKVLSTPPPSWDDSHVSQFQDRIISYLPDDPKHILIALDADEPTYPSVYRLNIYSGKKKRVMRHKIPIRTWFADQQGEIRAGLGLEQNGTEYSVWVKTAGQKEWQVLEEYDALASEKVIPLGFGLNPDLLYVRADHEGRAAIFTIDLAAQSYTRKLVASDPGHDINGGLVHSPKTRDVVGVYHYREPGGILYFDEEAGSFHTTLNRALPDAQNFIEGFSADEMKYLAYSAASAKPGVYYLGDRLIGRTQPIAQQYPLLQGASLGKSRYLRFDAADGEALGGYLWRPEGAAEKDLPLVLLPRSDFSFRDRGGFDPFIHFLVNRGYAVFRPNVRSGQRVGYSFVDEAWGVTAFSDMRDATQYLVREGIVDADRICIAGAGFAGYVALMSLVTDPRVYRCGISFGAVTSLLDYRATKQDFVGGDVVRKELGSSGKLLKQVSPREQASRIKAPVLLVHGERDRSVVISHGKKMASALKRTRVPYRYLELEDGSGDLTNEKHRVAFFEAVDDFLAEHLPVER